MHPLAEGLSIIQALCTRKPDFQCLWEGETIHWNHFVKNKSFHQNNNIRSCFAVFRCHED